MKPVEIPEALTVILRDMGACGYESKYTLADLRREIAKAILLARAEVHRVYGAHHRADDLRRQAAALGEEGEA
jgi:hypothetical protein